MDEITIRYWSPHGRQEETKFHSGHSKIDLVMRAAKEVDLTDLQECNKLEFLDLSNNMLESLDLSPLSNCSTLKEINLRNNHLTQIDLWPLFNSQSLRLLDLSENRLHQINLSPVFLKSKVKADSFTVIQADCMLRYVYTQKELSEKFHLIRPDGAPWPAVPVIIWTDHKAISKDIDWGMMKQRIVQIIESVPKQKWFSFQRGLLQSLGMSELSGYDNNPLDLIDMIDNEMPYPEARNAIYDRVLDLLQNQLENDGPTLFLDIENMKKTRASKLIPVIIELRKREIESTVVQIKGSRIFLRPLWLTHYGFTILHAMGMGLTTDSEGLERIERSFSKLDLTLKLKKVKVVQPSYSGKGSLGLQGHLFNLIRGMYD